MPGTLGANDGYDELVPVFVTTGLVLEPAAYAAVPGTRLSPLGPYLGSGFLAIMKPPILYLVRACSLTTLLQMLKSHRLQLA